MSGLKTLFFSINYKCSKFCTVYYIKEYKMPCNISRSFVISLPNLTNKEPFIIYEQNFTKNKNFKGML